MTVRQELVNGVTTNVARWFGLGSAINQQARDAVFPNTKVTGSLNQNYNR